MHRYQYYVIRAIVLTFISLWPSGCATYRTPSGGADFAVFADHDIKDILERKPTSPFPAIIATVRVQQPRYRSRTARGYGNGSYSVVSARDVEIDSDFERIANLPEISKVVPLNRLLLTGRLDSDRQLRQAAAALHADMIFIYTFDTGFYVTDSLIHLTVVSLGLSPNQQVRVSTTASAILMDVRTGYIYGSCESTAHKERIASGWTRIDAVDQSRLETERQSFEMLLDDFDELWSLVISERNASARQTP